MTQPEDTPAVGEGTDISEDDAHEFADADTPASSDPDEFTDDGELGGTSGSGGAG